MGLRPTRLMQSPPLAVGFGAASPPREVFLVRFGGFAAKTNQKLGFGAQPQDFAQALLRPNDIASALHQPTTGRTVPYPVCSGCDFVATAAHKLVYNLVMDETQRNRLKLQAAIYAADCVEAGMIVGLGFGSTALLAVRRIAARLHEGSLCDIVGVPCAEGTASLARELGIPLASLDDVSAVDLTIDGADEVDPQLNLIKGGGGALLREKMVAQHSQRVMIIVDEGKLSPALGTHWAVPIEVVEFGVGATTRWLATHAATVTRRLSADGGLYRTDQGNLILDCAFGPIGHPAVLARTLAERAGIVEHGLFVGLTTDLVIASVDGVRHLRTSE
jgi:ribose 5-phosphate isomerase A